MPMTIDYNLFGIKNTSKLKCAEPKYFLYKNKKKKLLL